MIAADQLALPESVARRVCTISSCHQYRYELGEFWDDSAPFDTWILCNPSTADGQQDDPTVRKVRGFAKRHERGGWMIVNAYALRATDPGALVMPVDRDPGGPRNIAFVTEWAGAAVDSGGRIILGWGGALPKRLRPAALSLVRSIGKDLWCLGTTGDGQPRHPLMLAYATQLKRFDPTAHQEPRP